MLFIIFMIPFAVLAALAIHYGIPAANRFFDLIWEDPSKRQQAAIARRLKELHVDGDVPAETAILMAAKERNVTEDELKDVAGMFGTSDIVGMLTGKRSPVSAFLSGIDKAMKRRKR